MTAQPAFGLIPDAIRLDEKLSFDFNSHLIQGVVLAGSYPADRPAAFANWLVDFQFLRMMASNCEGFSLNPTRAKVLH